MTGIEGLQQGKVERLESKSGSPLHSIRLKPRFTSRYSDVEIHAQAPGFQAKFKVPIDTNLTRNISAKYYPKKALVVLKLNKKVVYIKIKDPGHYACNLKIADESDSFAS